jgi:thiosulfate/3-mercaptopyruvate sulfurtransferase
MTVSKTFTAGLFALALSTGAALAQAAGTTPLGPLVTATDLDAAHDTLDPLILDIRGDAYAEGHIPEAVSAPYGLFRGPKENPGQLVAEDKLEATLQSLGVTEDRPIVIVHEGANETDFGAAARVYWTLKSSGLDELSILNGGFRAWTAAKLDTTKTATAPTPSTIDIAFSDEWLATTDEVLAAVGGEQEALLLDARPESFWSGNAWHPAAAQPGTLPQSRYFEHANWFSNGPAIVDASAARNLAQEQGLTDSDTLISFCNTGHWAATNWFALSELAGLDNVKLYPESMVGYSNAGHEMANVPGFFRHLYNQVRNVF